MSSWQALAKVLENFESYGPLRGSSSFRVNTALRIPSEPHVSRWMCDKLVENSDFCDEPHEGLATASNREQSSDKKGFCCLVCEGRDDEPGVNDLLLCDGCNAAQHVQCANLSQVPEGNWFCTNCLDILRARKQHYYMGNEKHPSLGALPSPLPPMDVEDPALIARARRMLDKHIQEKKVRELGLLQDNFKLKKAAIKEEISDQQSRFSTTSQSSWVIRAKENELQELLKQEQDEEELHQVKYAAYSGSPQLEFETKRSYRNRPGPPKLLGFCKDQSSSENKKALQTLANMSEEALLVVPMEEGEEDYAIYATDALFEPIRDDELALNSEVRTARRMLMSVLMTDARNSQTFVTERETPASVIPHKADLHKDDANSEEFGLNNLLKNCTTALDLPKTGTPQPLSNRGLKLREHQEVSLQWMLDKERNTTGLGTVSELWSRHRFIDSCEDYYYCDLTGSFLRSLFNFNDDTDQKDAAKNISPPVCGILGDEMGLGKTVVCIALVVTNPPPHHNRVLPLEYKWESFDHPEYCHPPSVLGATPSNRNRALLSNGTLVVAPSTLCSQWKEEVNRYAPFLQTIAIHTGDNPTLKELASSDLVISSTEVFKASRATKKMFGMLKRIHFHRMIVDEGHLMQQGMKMKSALAAIAATNRFICTGTPLGNSLDDLGGQLRFLRLPQFCRQDFWSSVISGPFTKHSDAAVETLLSVLSRVMVRHTKRQIAAHGKELLGLPPRTVTTALLKFGCEAEKAVYELLDQTAMDRFKELREKGSRNALSRYQELHGLVSFCRQACCHVSMIDLAKVNATNEARRKQGLAVFVPLENKDRTSILEEAMFKAKFTARGRIREIVMTFQECSEQMIECTICLEPITEENCAITPCGHPFCSECLLPVLTAVETRKRKVDPKGECPLCRDVIYKSSLTLLGEAKDAGDVKIVRKQTIAKSQGTKAVISPDLSGMSVNGFKLTARDIRLSAPADSTTHRVNWVELTDEERRKQRAHFRTLDNELLLHHEKASSCLGTKVSLLLEEIKSMSKKDPKSKCVVFSQYSSFLDICAEELWARGILFVRVDGGMKQFERADALHVFSSNPLVTVFLLSMKDGAVGLNLTAANHCFIMDVCQQTAREEQAIDRIHRIGQKREVFVKRFVMMETIEERILNSRRQLSNSDTVVSTDPGIDDEESCLRPCKRRRKASKNGGKTERLEHTRNLEGWFGSSLVKDDKSLI